ncbi:glycosyltransferase family 4 protein [Halomonas sp. CUBES01]|uniref:Glycosyltransferase family 4 protein n=1 Tax=Vreelandella gomseomensis TaxID=370766 RepID=A0ABU1GEU7_9GAMM|nr:MULTISPECIES: glycosyltransferase family 4 protein [Halomonas]MDR5876009.1 glycosyltransferase family 4 protein [Halomonas gomseomensis]MEC4766704.1 glycosyltransferase family 4 protein [Halomonas sp. CUBES01]
MTHVTTAIHQFHHGVDVGDGVTNSMLFIRKLLRRMGFASEIFAANIPGTLQGEIKPYHTLEDSNADTTVLLQHHSMGHELGNWLVNLAIPRVLVYHNITPGEFFSPGSDYRRYAELGREQLRHWRDAFIGVIAVSDFNAQDLVALDYDPDRISVIPLLVDMDKLAPPVGETTLPRLAHALHPALKDRPALVFIGRIVENKRQHLLLEMLWYLHRLRQDTRNAPLPMLILAGGGTNSPYGHFIRQRTHQLHLDDSVIMPGKVDDTLLSALYQQADAFVCASAHEGFGMPLLEAMVAQCPVVAMNTSNIAHTLGEGGLVLNDQAPAAMAAATELLLEDPALRQTVLEGQQRALDRYQPEVIAEQLSHWLAHTLRITPPASPNDAKGN